MKWLVVLVCSWTFCFADDVLSIEEIQDIYKKFVQVNYNDEYVSRYDVIPIEKLKDPKSWIGRDLPRIISILEFDRFIKANNLSFEKTLTFYSKDSEFDYFETKEVHEFLYTKDRVNHDLHTLNIPGDDYDFVMLNQTLEHLYNPLLCLKNVYKKLRSGGILYINVPACNRPHDTPIHFSTGFTAMGLATTIRMAGFELMQVGEWGNVPYTVSMFQGRTWPDYVQMNRNGHNDLHCPVITWAFARKP